MPHFLRSITLAWRRSVANRRKSVRHIAKRDVDLLINISVADGSQSVMPHEGYTRDLSEIGLSIVVPSLRVGGHYLTDRECRLRIVLADLTTGPVEIYAKPVRYEQQKESGGAAGHLIGARIIQMSESDRTRYVDYLRSLR